MDHSDKPSYEGLERKLGELSQERDFYQLIADNAYDWISYRDTDGKLSYSNKAFERITGYPLEDYLNGTVSVIDFIHPEDKEIMAKSFLALMNNSMLEKIKVRIIRSDKTIRHLRIYSQAVYADGQRIGIRSSARDITNEEEFKEVKKLNESQQKLISELETSKEEIEQGHHLFKDLFLLMNEGVYMHEFIRDSKGEIVNYRIIEANPSSEKHLGIKAKSAVGKTATDLYQVPTAPFLDIYINIFNNNEHVQFEEYFAPLGKWFSISAFGLTRDRFVTIFADITEKVEYANSLKKAKENAEESEIRLQTIVNAIPDLIWLKNVDGVYLGCNKRFEDFFGESEAEILGKTDYDFLEKGLADFFRKNDQIALDAGVPVTNEELVQFKSDGHEEYLETIKTPMFGRQGQLVGVLGIGRNITERKRFEHELLEAKERAETADRSKSLFLANMSHEIRTPMNGIIGFADLLDNDNLPPAQRNRFVKIIKNSGKQLLSIIDDILEISRLETKRVKPIYDEFNLNEMFAELYSIFRIDNNNNKIPLYLKCPLSDKNSLIYSDRSKLIKILSNLIENAFRYTEIGYIELGYYIDGSKLTLYVKDTGVGIAPEKQDQVFERFTQVEEKLSQNSGGLGLGLSIVKENTELLDGVVELVSETGKGTTFLVTIPYRVSAKNDSEDLLINTETGRQKRNSLILIVEDEEVNYMYLEALLNNFPEDYQILHAHNGLEAIEWVEKEPEIDLVLMDMKMPEMNGYEATKLIKKINDAIPVIAQTAYTTIEENQKAKEAGCDDIISKPISKEKFQQTLLKYLATNK